MKKVFWVCLILCVIGVSPVFPNGSWFDVFDEYADQAAMDNPTDPYFKWDSADGKAKGILDDSGHEINLKSMRCEQFPTETRPTRKIGDYDSGTHVWKAWQGCMTLWVYDDGADIKAFDVRISNSSSGEYVGLGLRDDQVGVDTEYTCNKNGTVINTGITRSVGWHIFQFNTNDTAGTEGDTGLSYVIGTEMFIDFESFTGNIYPSLIAVTDLTIYSNFGNATDPNTIWVDSVEWSGLGTLGVPRRARAGFVDRFQNGIASWYPVVDSNTALTNPAEDPPGDPNNYVLDAFDADGVIKGCYYDGVMVYPRTGEYIFDLMYMNGPTWAPHNAWPDLTVTVNGSQFYLGSTSTGTGWVFVEQDVNWVNKQKFGVLAGTPVSISVTGSATSLLNCFVRLDVFDLHYYGPWTAPVQAQKTWQLYE